MQAKRKRSECIHNAKATKQIIKRHIKAYAWNEANWRFSTAVIIQEFLPFGEVCN